MSQDLTFKEWVKTGLVFKKNYNENFYFQCLLALKENAHLVVNSVVMGKSNPYLKIINKPLGDNIIDEQQMLCAFRDLCKELIEVRKSKEKSAKMFSNNLKNIKLELSCEELVGHSKTALSMLSRYFRGLDSKYATQAEYIRGIYRPHLDVLKSKNIQMHTEKIRCDELKFLFTDARTTLLIKNALKKEAFKNHYRIECIEIDGNEITFKFQVK